MKRTQNITASERIGSVATLDGKTHKGTIPQSATSEMGASMRRGVRPVAYWHHGDGTSRTFYGATRQHAFQRAMSWGRDHKGDAR